MLVYRIMLFFTFLPGTESGMGGGEGWGMGVRGQLSLLVSCAQCWFSIAGIRRNVEALSLRCLWPKSLRKCFGFDFIG